jgi:hypothetical protein
MIDTNSEMEGSAFPLYGIINVDESFLRRMEILKDLCKTHGLSEVREYFGPEWLNEDAFRTELEELCCSGESFWFQAAIKHDGFFSTSRFSLDDLKRLFNQQSDGAVVYQLCHDATNAEAEYEEWLSENPA